MDYEQKYKEALERVKEWMAGKYGHYVSDTPQEIAEFIFPELKESDGERIRKQIISFLKEFEHDHYRSLDFSSWIAWLEKQGEQKDFAPKVEPKFKVGDRVNKNDREDEEHCILTITSVNIDEHCYVCNQCSVIDFGEQDLWHIVEQKPAWSEEDKKYLRRAINATRNGYPETNNWLKSLKERCTWKPSDEQMKALRFVKKAKILDPEERESLNSLYIHLKKLK